MYVTKDNLNNNKKPLDDTNDMYLYINSKRTCINLDCIYLMK